MTVKFTRELAALIMALAICLAASGCSVKQAAPTATATPPPTAAPEPEPTSEPEPTATVLPQPETVEQQREKADYLKYVFAYSITQTDLRDKLTDTATEECTQRFSGTADVAELCESWIYDGVVPDGYSSGAVFLTWSVDICGLIDTGTFPRTTDLKGEYDYLTAVNKFETVPLSDSMQFGGELYNIQKGDILFWMDDNGVAVNAGIVTFARAESIDAAICNSQSKVASFTLDKECSEEDIVKHCVVVKVTYTCNEQLVFLFLVNEMGYTNAVACGAMASIYCESMFEPNVEEQSFSEGYGICQWTGDRRAALEMWCSANGLDHSKLTNQLMFMKNELENNIAGDLDWRLRRMGNTEQDAYNAGVLWCERYENPGKDLAKQRGELARDSFFPAYSGHPYM